MDFNVILLGVLATLVALALLIVAGVVLPIRSYTQLLGLVEHLSSQLVSQATAHGQEAVATKVLVADLQATVAQLQAQVHTQASNERSND